MCECITLECERDETAGEGGAILEGPGKHANEFGFDREEQREMDPRFRSAFSSNKITPHFRVMWGAWRQSPVGSQNSSPSWTRIHGNLSESSSCGDEGPPGKGEERDLAFEWTELVMRVSEHEGQGDSGENRSQGITSCCHFGEPAHPLMPQT